MLMGNWRSGNSVYDGRGRQSFKGFKMGQYKLELKGRRFYVWAYTTQENAGQSFNATVTTRPTNEPWNPPITFNNGVPGPQLTDWLVQYAQAYLANKMGGAADIDAHNAARAVADQGRPAAGSQQFKDIFNKVRGVSISNGGGLFIEKSDLYQL